MAKNKPKKTAFIRKSNAVRKLKKKNINRVSRKTKKA